MNSQKLTKLAVEKAKKDFPNGFNKNQLMGIYNELKKDYYIGDPVLFGTIESHEDINKLHGAMIEGNYPASMTSCEVVGINGGCGVDCPVFRDGICDNVNEDEEEWINRIKKGFEGKEQEYHLDLYGLIN